MIVMIFHFFLQIFSGKIQNENNSTCAKHIVSIFI